MRLKKKPYDLQDVNFISRYVQSVRPEQYSFSFVERKNHVRA